MLKKYRLVLMAVAVLFVEAVQAKEPYCASPDITPTFYGGTHAVARYVKLIGGIVFYVSPTLDKRFHEDIKAAAKTWNEHLPQGAQIALTFSQAKWRSKIKTQSGKAMAIILEHAGGVLQRLLRTDSPNLLEDHSDFLPGGTIGSVEIDPAPPLLRKNLEDILAYAIPFLSQIFINNVDHQFYVMQKIDAFQDKQPFYGTILHEMGHTLGLDHNDHDPNSVMSRQTSRLARLSDSDIRAIRCAYGMGPPRPSLKSFAVPAP